MDHPGDRPEGRKARGAAPAPALAVLRAIGQKTEGRIFAFAYPKAACSLVRERSVVEDLRPRRPSGARPRRTSQNSESGRRSASGSSGTRATGSPRSTTATPTSPRCARRSKRGALGTPRSSKGARPRRRWSPSRNELDDKYSTRHDSATCGRLYKTGCPAVPPEQAFHRAEAGGRPRRSAASGVFGLREARRPPSAPRGRSRLTARGMR